MHPHTGENLSAINIAGEAEKAERLVNYGFWSRHMILERNESVQSQLIDIIRLIDIQIYIGSLSVPVIKFNNARYAFDLYSDINFHYEIFIKLFIIMLIKHKTQYFL